MMTQNGKKIIIGCTGSVATIKVPQLAENLISLGFDIIIVPTKNALHFLKCQGIADEKEPSLSNATSSSSNQVRSKGLPDEALENEIKLLYPKFKFVTDCDEWNLWQKRGDDIKHIELREWADIFLIAPLDANTLAKLACGLCDNLLTCIIRAWNLSKPILFCPAMNSHMYRHPFTSQHIAVLKNLGYEEIEVTCKTLMCGDTGLGAMAEIDVIVQKIVMKLETLCKG